MRRPRRRSRSAHVRWPHPGVVLLAGLLLQPMQGLHRRADATSIAPTPQDHVDSRQQLIEGVAEHLRRLGGEPRRIQLVARTLGEVLPEGDDLKADVEGDLLPRLRAILVPIDRSDPLDAEMRGSSWLSTGLTRGLDHTLLPALSSGRGEFEDDPEGNPNDARLLHFCRTVAVAASAAPIDAVERACVERVLDQTLAGIESSIREALEDAELPRNEMAFRLERLRDAIDGMSAIIAPHVGTALSPRLQTCRESLASWRRAEEELKARWRKHFLNGSIDGLRASCRDEQGRWLEDRLVDSRRSTEPLSGLLGSPHQVQVFHEVGRLLGLALGPAVPREVTDDLERSWNLVLLAGALERAGRNPDEESTGFRSLDEALVLGGIEIHDGLVSIPARLGPPDR